MSAPRMRVDVDLPSGVRARLLVTARCAVIEVNGLVTFAPRRNVSTDVAVELAGLLAELGEPSVR